MPLSLPAGDQIGELGSESPGPRMALRKSSESEPGSTCPRKREGRELGSALSQGVGVGTLLNRGDRKHPGREAQALGVSVALVPNC